MNKYLNIFIILIITILFSACGDENEKSYTETEIEQKVEKAPMSKKAITFPILPSKNIDVSTLENM